jgi:hypothetical protein
MDVVSHAELEIAKFLRSGATRVQIFVNLRTLRFQVYYAQSVKES